MIEILCCSFLRTFRHRTASARVSSVLLLLSLLGCSNRPLPPSGDSALTLRLSDAVDLQRVLRADEQPDLAYKLQTSRDQAPIYFGEVYTYDNDDEALTSTPIIAQKSGASWRALRIDDPRLNNSAWALVASGPARGEIWGVLDQAIDSNGEAQADVVIVHSTDAGKNFAVTAIRKPVPSAVFDSMSIASDGRGKLTLYLAADAGASRKFHSGYYSMATYNAGQTWSQSKFEPDALITARPVSDDEQPDVQNPITTASFTNK